MIEGNKQLINILQQGVAQSKQNIKQNKQNKTKQTNENKTKTKNKQNNKNKTNYGIIKKIKTLPIKNK